MTEITPEVLTSALPLAGRSTNWKGVVGIVLGYLGSAPALFNRWYVLAPLISVVAGVLMLRDIGQGATSSKKLAYAAIVVGILLTALGAALIIGLPLLGAYLEDHNFG
jgi:hypothetical protein